MTNSEGETIVEVEGLRKRYGEITAVDGISFSIKRGEIFAILGPNGSGKTTTIETIEGMRTADSGMVTVDGIDVAQDPNAVKRIIGVQLQSNAFIELLNLGELLNLLASIYGGRVDPIELLEKVNLADRRRARFRHLSGGQQQRFSIASTLVNDPKIIFLDEPTTGLDPHARRQIWDLIASWRDEGRTVLLTTHYMEEAETLCDRLAVMHAGRIIALDTPGGLIQALLDRGFDRHQEVRAATLEDVFLDLTGEALREA